MDYLDVSPTIAAIKEAFLITKHRLTRRQSISAEKCYCSSRYEMVWWRDRMKCSELGEKASCTINISEKNDGYDFK